MTPDKMPPNLMSEVFTLCEGAPNLKLGALSLGFFFNCQAQQPKKG